MSTGNVDGVHVRKRKAKAVGVSVPDVQPEAAGWRISFTVAGPPVGKARPRVTKRGTFTPERTRCYEAAIRNVASLMVSRDWPTDRRYRLHVGFTGRSDGDNVFKSVADALEGIFYANDRQVDEGSHKRISAVPHPRTVITIEVLP